jgi:hypothetical protein
VHSCTGTEALYRSYGKVHPCTGRTVKCTLVQALRLCTGRTVKCTLVQALRLCTGRTAKSGSSGIALPFHDQGTRRGLGVSVTPRPLFTPGKTRYPLYRRLGGSQGRSGKVRKISPPTGIRSPDRPARSQSLYRLSYPAHQLSYTSYKNGSIS